MKKNLSFIGFFGLFASLLGIITFTPERVNEVFFEGFNLNKYSTAEEITETLNETELIEVLLKLDYPEFTYAKKNLENENSANINLVSAFESNEELIDTRNSGKLYHYQRNVDIFNELNVTGYSYYNICQYIPYIEYIFETENLVNNELSIISELQRSSSVHSITISDLYQEKEENLNLIIERTDERNLIESGKYSGAGVKIGLLDAGIIDENHPALIDSNFEIRTEWYFIELVSDHSTKMATVIGGNYGVARDAKIYSVHSFGNPSGEVDWLVGQGVNLINVSMGYNNPDGVYSSISAMFDLAIATYNIAVFASTGNGAEYGEYVSNPALGLNVVSVGASNGSYNNILSFSADRILPNTASSPTLTAPGWMVTPCDGNNVTTGTSVSCAFTTGVAALDVERRPAFKNSAMQLAAHLIVSCKPIVGFRIYNNAGFDYNAGAGGLYLGYIETGLNLDFVNHNKNKVNTVIFTDYTDLLPGETFVYAIAWYARANGKANGTVVNDYDLRFVNRATGLEVGRTTSIYDNMEVFRFTNNTSSLIYIDITCVTGSDRIYTGTEYIYSSINYLYL